MPEDKNQNGLREIVNFGLLQVVRAESLTPVLNANLAEYVFP